MEIIRRCKNERNRDIAKILMAGSGVMGLGLALSANKKQIIQYAAIRTFPIFVSYSDECYGIWSYDRRIWILLVLLGTSTSFGTCIPNPIKVLSLDHFKCRVFESQPKSRTAEFLNIMGYDKK